MSLSPRSPTPAQVLIIRHAEKPGDAGTDAATDGPDLSPRGFLRAAALATHFAEKFARPDHVFATARSTSSNRPIETVTPLADALDLPVNAPFSDRDYEELAQQILEGADYGGKVILVCWHHKKIPRLAGALGVSDPPSPWPDEVFDRVWRLGFDAGSVTLTVLPQGLLDGDA